MKTYELSPGKFDRVKSFYGKARIIEKDSGERIYNLIIRKCAKSHPAVNL